MKRPKRHILTYLFPHGVLPNALRQTLLKLLHFDALQRRKPEDASDYQRLLERNEWDEETNRLQAEQEELQQQQEQKRRREAAKGSNWVKDWIDWVLVIDPDEKEEEEPPEPTIQLPFALTRWVKQATEQMRWKRARPYAARELKSHLQDQYEAFRADGLDESAAVQATVNEMGDAVEVGTGLDHAWRPQHDWLTMGIILVIAAVGLVLQSVLYASTLWDTSWPTQLVYYVLGVGMLLGMYLADYTWIGRNGTALYVCWVAIGFVAFVGGRRIGGVCYDLRQWLNWFPPVFAGVLYSQHRNGSNGLWNCLLALLAPCILCLFAPYMFGLVALLLVSCLTMVVAIWRGLFGKRTVGKLVLSASPLLLSGAGAVYLLATMPHLRQRILDAYLPLQSPLQGGYMGSIIQHMMFGVPLPSDLISPQQTETALVETLSTNTVDFFLTAVKYKWGWLAFALVLGAVLVLLARGFSILRRQTGVLAFFLNQMILLTLTVQTVAYLHQTFGFILLMSNGLPLLSYGRTYLLRTMAFLGLLLATHRMGKLEPNLPPRRKPTASPAPASTPAGNAAPARLRSPAEK